MVNLNSSKVSGNIEFFKIKAISKVSGNIEFFENMAVSRFSGNIWIFSGNIFVSWKVLTEKTLIISSKVFIFHFSLAKNVANHSQMWASESQILSVKSFHQSKQSKASKRTLIIHSFLTAAFCACGLNVGPRVSVCGSGFS